MLSLYGGIEEIFQQIRQKMQLWCGILHELELKITLWLHQKSELHVFDLFTKLFNSR